MLPELRTSREQREYKLEIFQNHQSRQKCPQHFSNLWKLLKFLQPFNQVLQKMRDYIHSQKMNQSSLHSIRLRDFGSHLAVACHSFNVLTSMSESIVF